jgi:TolA-binding protein
MKTPIRSWRCVLSSLAGNIVLATMTVALAAAPVAAGLAQGDKGDKRQGEKGDKGGKADKAADDAHLAKVKEHLGVLEREIAELREAGKKEEAEKLMQEARELKAVLEKHGGTKGSKSADAGDGKDKKPVKSPDKPGAKGDHVDKLQHLKREIEELRAAGRTEEAEKLAAKLRDHAAHLDKEHAAKDKNAGASALDEKIVHLKKQVAELLEAGRKEEAEKLILEIERMHEDSAVIKKKADSGKPDKKPEAVGEKSSAGAEIKELGQAISSLREEVARLRDEVAELRRQLKNRE